jgi:hypothetical protein
MLYNFRIENPKTKYDYAVNIYYAVFVDEVVSRENYGQFAYFCEKLDDDFYLFGDFYKVAMRYKKFDLFHLYSLIWNDIYDNEREKALDLVTDEPEDTPMEDDEVTEENPDRYHDIETDEIITDRELWEEYDKSDERHEMTFGQYKNNCMTYNGGTLERI